MGLSMVGDYHYRRVRLVAESVSWGDSMFRTVKNATAALALAGLVISQPALAVRSSDSLPAPGVQVSHVNSRVGTPVGQSEHVAGVSTIGWVLGLLIVVGTIAIVASDHNHTKSPG